MQNPVIMQERQSFQRHQEEALGTSRRYDEPSVPYHYLWDVGVVSSGYTLTKPS